MDFIDEAKIYISSGKGGDGSTSFRREKYVPRGGPDGGSGGKGGDVIFQTNSQLTTLQDFKFRPHHKAKDGRPGGGKQKTGRSGEDLIIEVPVGTLIRHLDTREILVDLDRDKQTFLAAQGGRGGRGNLCFVSSTHQAPKTAEKGDAGEEFNLLLELKLLADVALVGFPNAGKSTLLASISAARPKIADYPFTTQTPQLGVVNLNQKGESNQFVVADIPGILKGAHQGRGLGLRFLKHIERSHLLWFVLELPDKNNETTMSLKETYESLLEELKGYPVALEKRPRIVLLSKSDLYADPNEFSSFTQDLKDQGIPYFFISAFTKTGLEPPLWKTLEMLVPLKAKPGEPDLEQAPGLQPS